MSRAASKRRGRPRLCEGPTEQLAVLLPQPVYDALSLAAIRSHRSMGEVVREAVEQHIRHPQNRQPPVLPAS